MAEPATDDDAPPGSLAVPRRLPFNPNDFLPPPPDDTPPPAAPPAGPATLPFNPYNFLPPTPTDHPNDVNPPAPGSLPPFQVPGMPQGGFAAMSSDVLGAPPPAAPPPQTQAPAGRPGVSSLVVPPARPALQDPGFPARPTASDRPEPPKPQYRDPLMALNNPLTLIALAASLFTRNSAVAAGNAMAGAVEAQRKGDQQEYKNQYQVYQQELAKWQREDTEQKNEYDAILRERKLSLDERNSKLRMSAHRRGDSVMLAELDANGNPQAVVDTRAKLGRPVTKAVEKRDFVMKAMKDDPTLTNDDAQVMWLKHEKDIKDRAAGVKPVKSEEAFIGDYISTHPGTSRADAEREWQKAKEEGKRQGKGVTANKAADIQLRITSADEALSKIDKVIGTLEKYRAAAGLAGKVFRGVEAIGNISGATAETDRKQMARDIAEIQSMYPKITGGSGRPLAMDQKKVDDIIGGLATGDTTANTIRSMQEAQETIMRFRSTYQQSIGGGASPQPGAAPAPAAPEGNPWDAFPSR